MRDSCVNTAQQNIIVSRKHYHLLNVARALMIQSHLSKIYWSYFMIHVVHTINMLPTPVLKYFSPHEMLYKTASDFNQLNVFGSLCYTSTLSTNKSKFDPRASKFNLEKFVSRDVVFYEHVFSYQRVEDTSNEFDSPSIHDQSPFIEDQFFF